MRDAGVVGSVSHTGPHHGEPSGLGWANYFISSNNVDHHTTPRLIVHVHVPAGHHLLKALLHVAERSPRRLDRLGHRGPALEGPGERRKHDRKDAEDLARLYRAGELVTIRVPTEREERVRDLVRCRETFQREALKSRHYILKFLARRGLVYREGQNWTGKHMTWLRAIQRDAVLETEDQAVFGEYLALLDYKLDRREELDRQIEALALEPSYKEAVGRLCCLKGISTQAAMVPVTEIGDFRRFEHPGKLMAYVCPATIKVSGLRQSR